MRALWVIAWQATGPVPQPVWPSRSSQRPPIRCWAAQAHLLTQIGAQTTTYASPTLTRGSYHPVRKCRTQDLIKARLGLAYQDVCGITLGPGTTHARASVTRADTRQEDTREGGGGGRVLRGQNPLEVGAILNHNR